MILKKYDEQFIVKPLISRYKEFDEFYKNERHKLTSNIDWIKDPRLPIGVNARMTIAGSKIYLKFRNMPQTFDDARTIAHEIQHIIHDKVLKIPSVGTAKNSNFHNLSSAINSSIHDQKVNRDLLKYDFDLCAEFEAEIEDSKKQLSRFDKAPSESYSNLHWAVNYADRKATYQFITNEYEFDDYTFFNWFENRFPQVAERSTPIKKAILSVDLDSNQSMSDYFKWMILSNRLQKHIFIFEHH